MEHAEFLEKIRAVLKAANIRHRGPSTSGISPQAHARRWTIVKGIPFNKRVEACRILTASGFEADTPFWAAGVRVQEPLS